MILVDPREGSKNLVKPLRDLGLPVKESHLDYGDLAFMGRGEKGAKLFIGVEHKTISDLVSSMGTGRLQGHQIPGMTSAYDRRWLVVEGDWDKDSSGRVTKYASRGVRRPIKGAPLALELLKRLIVLNIRAGVNIWPSKSQRASLDFILALYRVWTDKDLDEHKSHTAIYAPDLDRGLLVPVSDFRKGLVSACPGVGFALSRTIENRCYDSKKGEGSWGKLLALTVDDLAALETTDRNGGTKRIGLSRARDIKERLT